MIDNLLEQWEPKAVEKWLTKVDKGAWVLLFPQ